MVGVTGGNGSTAVSARRSPSAWHDAVEVTPINDALAAAQASVVARHLDPGMVDADLATSYLHGDLGADQLPWHAVMVGIDVDAGVVLHAPGQLAELAKRGTTVQQAQRLLLIALEPHHRRLAGRTVHPRVGHLAHPPGQVRLERAPRCEAPAGNGVVLDVTDTALVLTLGASTVGRTRDRPHVPVAGKACRRSVNSTSRVAASVVPDQRTGIVEQQLAWQTAEMAERALDPLQPLVAERRRIDPPRVAKRGHKQEHLARALALDGHPALTEIDLQLATWRGLEPHRQRFCGQLAPQMRHRTLDRAKADGDAQFRRQLLAHHVRIAPMTPQPLREPVSVPRQQAGTGRNPAWSLDQPSHSPYRRNRRAGYREAPGADRGTRHRRGSLCAHCGYGRASAPGQPAD